MPNLPVTCQKYFQKVRKCEKRATLINSTCKGFIRTRHSSPLKQELNLATNTLGLRNAWTGVFLRMSVVQFVFVSLISWGEYPRFDRCALKLLSVQNCSVGSFSWMSNIFSFNETFKHRLYVLCLCRYWRMFVGLINDLMSSLLSIQIWDLCKL